MEQEKRFCPEQPPNLSQANLPGPGGGAALDSAVARRGEITDRIPHSAIAGSYYRRPADSCGPWSTIAWSAR
ncbi:hypothetical protein GCM10027535_55250 [Mycolicibacterium hippocampi]|uniref:Uncharacterized protein n=1 Tax=Mycolicibacterium hippocampi TaxID=659824 RepID=A0A7I9ZMF6_9MYCO|nr:hypothetical protein MHIP_24000 [Mycolicibacterium hippocampi]